MARKKRTGTAFCYFSVYVAIYVQHSECEISYSFLDHK